MISSARDLDQFRLLKDDPIQRRIGLHNFKKFQDYDNDELFEFMKDIIKERRQTGFSAKEKLKMVETQEKINEDTYPFTEDSLKEIISHVKYLADNNKIAGVRPSEHLDLMDLCISKAKHVIHNTINSQLLLINTITVGVVAFVVKSLFHTNMELLLISFFVPSKRCY